MAIGLGTALTIGAIASAAGSGTKAVMQSRAANKAAKQQEAGARQASGYLQQGLGQLGQLYQPYINSGAGAIGTLGRLTTPGAGARFASPGPPNAMPQASNVNTAVPRMGPYYMAEGGDVVVDKPTVFVAGEAGPERATFQPMRRSGGASDALRAKLLEKYTGGAPQAPGDPRQAMRAMAGAQAMGGPFRGGGMMPMQGAGGWAGTFGQMGGQPMRRPMPMEGGAPPQQQPQQQPPPMVPQWAPEPPQGWGYY